MESPITITSLTITESTIVTTDWLWLVGWLAAGSGVVPPHIGIGIAAISKPV